MSSTCVETGGLELLVEKFAEMIADQPTLDEISGAARRGRSLRDVGVVERAAVLCLTEQGPEVLSTEGGEDRVMLGDLLRTCASRGRPVAAIHNHPSAAVPSFLDMAIVLIARDEGVAPDWFCVARRTRDGVLANCLAVDDALDRSALAVSLDALALQVRGSRVILAQVSGGPGPEYTLVFTEGAAREVERSFARLAAAAGLRVEEIRVALPGQAEKGSDGGK